ncbi:hypothetical protein JOM56_007017, partial [Amanita muscaria]
MKAKTLLAHDNLRPRWAYIAENLIRRNVPSHYRLTDPQTRINPFLQDWQPYKNNVKANSLPSGIHRLLKSARTHNITFDPINPSRQVAMSMPFWRHPGFKQDAKPSIGGNIETCLRSHHHVSTIGDLVILTSRLQFPNHNPRKNCACDFCKKDRESGCGNPSKCATKANRYLNSLPYKWDPRTIPSPQFEPHINVSRSPIPGNDGSITTFDKRIESSHEISDGFRVFWKKEKRCDATFRDLIPDLSNDTPLDRPPIIAYTDGSCIQIGSTEAKAGSGAWFGPGDEKNTALRLPQLLATNNAGELTAILAAASQVSPWENLHIRSD